MSQPLPTPASNPRYDPLPLSQDVGEQPIHLNNMDSPYLGPSTTPLMSDLPAGAGQPRFLGTALYDDPSHAGPRDSYASSQNTFQTAGNTDSVYALNANGANRESQFNSYRDDPRDEGEPGSLAMSNVGSSSPRLEEKRATYASPHARSKRRIFIIGAIVALILLILAVIIPVYFAVIKPNSRNASSGSNSSGSNSGNGDGDGKTGHNGNGNDSPGEDKPQVAITGGDGSEITMEDGTKFTYNNKFGGTWYYDPEDPFNNNAQAQSWTTPLNGSFKYGEEKIRGVNVGGWLNTEPFMVPALYEKFPSQAVDEWTLSENLRADTANGGIQQLEDHYKTFITEKDFADIAAAGLNYVRLPIGWWAIEVREGEPHLERVSWTYFLKAIQWARKYGLRINLDLHAVPGSQNGWNHSGKLGAINFLTGPMGYANAQRTLDYIRILAEFISQPQYSPVVTMFGILNEPQGNEQAGGMGDQNLRNFYYEAYRIIRTAGGTGEGNGPWISIHDGFAGRDDYVGFMTNADRITIDTHPYMCFHDQSSAPMSTYATRPCDAWAAGVNNSMTNFGLTNAGEFSNAVTDCGYLLNGVGDGTRYEGDYKVGSWPSRGSCDEWNDWTKFDDARKAAIKQFALASMDALQNYFFWNWKIGNSTVHGRVYAPDWSYLLGLEQGWMPTDPREADGVCGNTNPFVPPLSAWHTGGAGAGQNINTAGLEWPPSNILSANGIVQTYVPDAPIITMPVPTFSPEPSASIDAGSGWANSNDNQGMHVMPAGCAYIDPWIGPTAVITPCTGTGATAPSATPAP